MKNDTVFMVLKGVGLIGGAMVASALGSVSQWINAGVSPSAIDWLVMGLGVAGAFFAALVAFCSGSAEKWRQARTNGNSGTTLIAKP